MAEAYRQLNLTEQEQLNRMPFSGHALMHIKVLQAGDFYARRAPEAYNRAVEFVNFWGALANTRNGGER
jgi:hypothetical protein